MSMSKLSELSGYFDELRSDGVIYTEADILKVLEELKVDQYELVSDVPIRVLNQVLSDITESKCGRMDPNQEQEMLDFLEQISLKGLVNLEKISKALRYLMREDTSKKTAFIIVDVQNDFISGSLALRNTPFGQEGEEVVPVINKLLNEHTFDFVAYSLDWHPLDHCSFASNVSKYPLHESSECAEEHAVVFKKVIYAGEKVLEQILWPDHCVQLSEGAKLHADLKIVDNGLNIYKGTLSNVDSYSAFWDNGKLSQTKLLTHLFDNDITTVFTCGIAYDLCVGMTTLDSAEHGFSTFVIDDATKGISKDCMESMKEKLGDNGVTIIQSEQITKHL